MSTEQTDAIVLRMVPFSETSLIVTLYTRDLGRISALAKGARRPKSPFEGSLDLLSVCRIVVICKSSDALELLTEAKLQRRFRAAQKSLVRLYCGYYVAEMLRLWTDDGASSDELYDLTLRTIQNIDGDGDALRAVVQFELSAMRILGNVPATQSCVCCGQDIDPDGARVAFAYELGGVLCQECRSRQRGVVSIKREVIAEIYRLQHCDHDSNLVCETSARYSDSAEYPDYRELRATLSRYISTTLGFVPRTQSLLPASWVSH
ncbi:MAG TPA: DNA repair protein RecO [Planctomycetaceae bacterium]|nr:DNA repair protein RecO [Planctomycetaceae bacterium]